jgi:hypothetical protein
LGQVLTYLCRKNGYRDSKMLPSIRAAVDEFEAAKASNFNKNQ